MKKAKIPRGKIRGKNRKKLFACLLALTMIPANGGVTIFAAQKQTETVSKQKNATIRRQAENDQQPEFAEKATSVNIGEFKEIRFNNVTEDTIIDLKSDDESIVRVARYGNYGDYYYEPRNTGLAKIEAEFTTEDGETYTDSIEVTVDKNEENVVPIKSWNVYRGLENQDGDGVDVNNDHKITKDEIEKVYSISLNDAWDKYKISKDDLSGLDQAVNCKKFSLETVKKDEAIEFAAIQKLIGNLSNLKTLYLSGPSIYQDEIDEFMKMENVKNLESLGICECPGFESIDVSQFAKLNSLTLEYMDDVKQIKGLGNLTDLKKLSLSVMEGLSDFSEIGKLRNLEDLDLSYTEINSVEPIKNLKNLKKIKLISTQITAKDRLSLIKTDKIELEAGEKQAYPVYPIGIIENSDHIKLETDSSSIALYDEVSRYGLEAKKNSAGATGVLKISNDGTTYAEIPISVVEEKEGTPAFEEKDKTISIGYTGEVKFKNTDNIGNISFEIKDENENDGEDILDIYEDYRGDKDRYYFTPKKPGKVNVTATFTSEEEDQSYEKTMTVNVTDISDGYLPIKNRRIYEALVDDNDNSVDTNKDDRIDTTEIGKVTKIKANYSKVDNNDFTYLDKAVNCKEMNLSDNRSITDLSFISSFPKLREINLDGNGNISDYTDLIKNKGQFDKIILPAQASDSVRKDLITTDNISLDKGQTATKEIKPEGLLKDTDKVSVEDDNIAEAKIVPENDEDIIGAHLEITGKNKGTTTLKIQMGSEIKEIKVSVKAPNPTNPGDNKPQTPSQNPTTEAPKPTQPTTSTEAPKKVEKITVTAPSNKLASDKKVKLTANISNDASNKKIKWTTSNSKYATVDQNGVVKFNKKAAGKTVIITAMATDGSGKTTTFKIKIMKGSVQKITISGKKSVKAGKTLKLKAKVKAGKGANKKLIWTSSNTKYATVSSSGKVKALKAGKKKSVKITAMATDGSGKKATVTIKIK